MTGHRIAALLNDGAAFRGALSLRICAALDAQPHVDECVAFKKIFLRNFSQGENATACRAPKVRPYDKVE